MPVPPYRERKSDLECDQSGAVKARRHVVGGGRNQWETGRVVGRDAG